MDELLAWIKQNGFDLGTDVPTLDGKIHRFDRDGKKSAWFWGVQAHTSRSGQPYVIAKVGDWKTDEEFEFRTNGAFTKEDRKVITDKMKEAQAKAAREKEKLQLEVADEAVGVFAGFRYTHATGYMAAKQIPEHYGAKVGKDKNGEFLAVPLRDANGRLWGFQKIYNTGAKYFLTGSRKQGCFHMIPDDAGFKDQDVVYICEGFATAATVYQATGKLTVVAFDAGNLLSVTQAIRGEAPDLAIIICGDDDAWGKRGDGSPYNAGREKGEEAAEKCLAKVIFPKFRDDSSKPSDWNDLQRLEGLEAVKIQIAGAKPEKHYVRYLGHRDRTYFYTSSSNREIVTIQGGHGSAELLNLMPLAYWETMYPGKKTTVDWNRAADDLMSRCRARGIFHAEHIRGLGVWEDQNRIVMHLGDRLVVDGAEIDIHDIHSRFIYQLGQRARSPHPEPLTLEECAPIVAFLNEVRFERPEQRYFLGGWIMAARLSGFLRWRPQMWVTGESGSGKSTLLQRFLFPMLGEQKMTFTGGTTEAGMRQSIRANAVPVVFDEFEPDGPESAQRVRSCIEFIRQASTDAGHIVKGSAGGESMQYKARFCAAVSAIKTLLNSQADRSRFTLIELKKVERDPRQWDRIKDRMRAFTPEFADRYFARVIHMLPVLRKNMAAFENAFAEQHSQRLGQQYAPLLAGWTLLVSDDVLEPAEVDELVGSIDFTNEGAAAGESDQQDCLNHLLHKSITLVHGGERREHTVAEAILIARTDVVYNEEIQRYGLKVTLAGGAYELFVAARNPQLAQVFRDSGWVGGWVGSLSRLPEAKRNAVVRIHRKNTRGVALPLSMIFDEATAPSVKSASNSDPDFHSGISTATH